MFHTGSKAITFPVAARGPGKKQGDPTDVRADIEADIAILDDRRIDLLLQGIRPGESAQIEQEFSGLFRTMQDSDRVDPPVAP